MDVDVERKAFEMGTLPKYIYAPNNMVRDFFSAVQKYPLYSENGAFISPLTLYERENDLSALKMDLTANEVLIPFTLYNSNYRELVRNFREDFFFFYALGMAEDEIKQLERLWREDHSELDAAFKREIEEFRDEYGVRLAEKEAVEQVPPFEDINHVTVSKSKVYSFEKRATLLDLFNELRLSVDLPLITTSKFHKVLEGYPYVPKYPENEDTMFLFFRGEILTVKFTGSYTDPLFEVTLLLEDPNEIKSLLKVSDFKLVKEQLNVNVELAPPILETFNFNKYIWADLVMNNSAISDIFAIDEHLRTYKATSLVFMYYFPAEKALPGKEPKKIGFTIKNVDDYDAKSDAFITKMLVRVYNCDEKHIVPLISDICGAMGFYLSVAKDIAKEYNKYLNLPIYLPKPKPEEKTLRLKDIEPELFLAGFRRSCQYDPKIINEIETQKKEQDGYKIMLFPKTDQEGVRQHNYSCAHHAKHVFPGLRYNNLANSDQFKYLPCCFTEDQSLKDSPYREYTEGKKGAGGERRGFAKTDKMLAPDQTGEVPAKLKALFTLVGSRRAQRKGVARSASSILECISKAARKDRESLARLPDEILGVSSQEYGIFGGGIQQARAFLRDEKMYLDPRLFYTLFEYRYSCRLLLLSKEDFVFPNFKTTFAHFDSRNPIVILYENYGGGSAREKMPQWEIVTDVKQEEAEKLYELYIAFCERYVTSGGGEIRAIHYEETDLVGDRKIKSQILNSCGQTIALNMEEKGVNTTYRLAHPCPPVPIPISQEVFSNPNASPIRELSIPYKKDIHYNLYNLRPITSIRDSWLKEFKELRQTSTLLVEQAKHLLSEGKNIKESNKLNEVSVENKWLSGLSAPRDIKRKLEYAVKIFAKNDLAEFKKYRDYKVIPNKYTSVSDFKRSSREFILSNDVKSLWINKSFELLEKPAPNKSFFLQISSKVYNCVHEDAEGAALSNVNVCVFNTRTIFSVGAPKTQDVSYLFFLDEKRNRHRYRCYLV